MTPEETGKNGVLMVLSIGYERRAPEELIAILTEHHVVKLLDIREAPVSRRRGYSKRALAQSLTDAGIEYVHLDVAGNPYRKESDRDHCLSMYRHHLRENPAIIAQVAQAMASQPVAFLCYERLHSWCHRSVLLDTLAESGQLLEVVKVE